MALLIENSLYAIVLSFIILETAAFKQIEFSKCNKTGTNVDNENCEITNVQIAGWKAPFNGKKAELALDTYAYLMFSYKPYKNISYPEYELSTSSRRVTIEPERGDSCGLTQCLRGTHTISAQKENLHTFYFTPSGSPVCDAVMTVMLRSKADKMIGCCIRLNVSFYNKITQSTTGIN